MKRGISAITTLGATHALAGKLPLQAATEQSAVASEAYHMECSDVPPARRQGLSVHPRYIERSHVYSYTALCVSPSGIIPDRSLSLDQSGPTQVPFSKLGQALSRNHRISSKETEFLDHRNCGTPWILGFRNGVLRPDTLDRLVYFLQRTAIYESRKQTFAAKAQIASYKIIARIYTGTSKALSSMAAPSGERLYQTVRLPCNRQMSGLSGFLWLGASTKT